MNTPAQHGNVFVTSPLSSRSLANRYGPDHRALFYVPLALPGTAFARAFQTCVRLQRQLEGDTDLTMLPFGGGERVCLGKALAELEIQLIAVVELLGRLSLRLAHPVQDLALQLIASPSARGGLLVLGTEVSAP